MQSNSNYPTDAELDATIGQPLEWGALWAAMASEPDRWQTTTAEMFYDMLGAVPPAAMGGSAFLVGEASSWNARGEDVFACFTRHHDGTYGARYMTKREFQEFLAVRSAGASSDRLLPIRRLICCCCGCGTVGRQWRGRDTGFGLCDKCADRIAERGESAQEMLTNYGQKGIHYKVAP